MVETSIIILFSATFLAGLLTLADCWLRGRFMFAGLQRERALLDAGFVPMPVNTDPRLRDRVRFEALAMPNRTPSHRLADRLADRPANRGRSAAAKPDRQIALAHGAA